MSGVPCAINLDETGAVGAVNMERPEPCRIPSPKTRQFCEQVLSSDVLLVPVITKIQAAAGSPGMNLLAYGEFPDNLTIIPPVIFCFRVGLSS